MPAKKSKKHTWPFQGRLLATFKSLLRNPALQFNCGTYTCTKNKCWQPELAYIAIIEQRIELQLMSASSKTAHQVRRVSRYMLDSLIHPLGSPSCSAVILALSKAGKLCITAVPSVSKDSERDVTSLSGPHLSPLWCDKVRARSQTWNTSRWLVSIASRLKEHRN